MVVIITRFRPESSLRDVGHANLPCCARLRFPTPAVVMRFLLKIPAGPTPGNRPAAITPHREEAAAIAAWILVGSPGLERYLYLNSLTIL